MIEIDDLHWLRKPGFTYVATPYTRYPAGHDAAYQYAHRISAALTKFDIAHFCPVAVGHAIGSMAGIDPYDPEFWPAFCQPAMNRARDMLIVKLTGWDTSVGIGRERAYFGSAGKPVYSITPAGLFGLARQLSFEGIPEPRFEVGAHAASPLM